MSPFKTCTKCKTEKPVTDFCRDSSRQDGLHSWCRNCQSEMHKKYFSACDKGAHRAKVQAWRTNNVEASREISRRAHVNNRDKRNESSRRYRAENLEHMRELGRNWAKNNPEKARQFMMKRRAAKCAATPSWAEIEWERFVMQEAADLAVLRTKETGVKWHVDHVVPLRSKKVCGLHVAANMQLLPAAINVAKGNRIWPNMWTESKAPECYEAAPKGYSADCMKATPGIGEII